MKGKFMKLRDVCGRNNGKRNKIITKREKVTNKCAHTHTLWILDSLCKNMRHLKVEIAN